MSAKNAAWIVVFCLAFIGITWWGVMEIENDMDKHYQGVVKQLTAQKDSVQNLLDSVDAELLRTTIDMGRYQVALGILYDINPQSAEEYQRILSQETE